MTPPIPIQPVSILRKIADAVQITGVQLELFTTATVFVDLIKRNAETGNELVSQQHIVLTPMEYANWADDDEWLVQIVLERLGVQRATEIQPEAP
jgi:hypothetical protein